MTTTIVDSSFELLTNQAMHKRKCWLGTTYDLVAPYGSGNLTYYPLNAVTSMTIMRDCTHEIFQYENPFAQQGMVQICCFTKGSMKIRFHPEEDWIVFNHEDLIYFDWSTPIFYYDFQCENVDGISLYMNIHTLSSQEEVIAQTLQQAFQHHRIFGRKSLPIHQAIASQLIFPYSETLTNELLIQSRALELLAHVIQYSTARETALSYDESIFKVKQKIDTDYERPLQVQNLANEFQISKVELQKQFKLVYGCTVYRYIQKTRMKNAAEALLVTEKPITEIAFDVGYDNPSKFSTVFKKYYGLTPLHYRKRNAI